MYSLVCYGLASLIMSLIFIPLFKSLAIRMGIVDVPDGKIKVHATTTPYLGGVAIVCVMILLSVIIGLIENKSFIPHKVGIGGIAGLILLAILGFIDDVIVISPFQKAAGQAFISCLFIASGYCLRSSLFPQCILQLVSFFWFILVSNALNLVDIMDGLAGTITLVALAFFGCWSYFMGDARLTSFIVILSASVLGFLWNNKPRATIYLGDSGALFLGGVLSLVPFLLGVQHESNIHFFLASIIVLGIPLAETFVLIVVRTYKKIPFYRGSPHHFICYLRNKGWKEVPILSFVALLGVALGGLATAFIFKAISFCATSLCAVFMLFLAIFVIYF